MGATACLSGWLWYLPMGQLINKMFVISLITACTFFAVIKPKLVHSVYCIISQCHRHVLCSFFPITSKLSLLSTTHHQTFVLIGQRHELFNFLANYDMVLKTLYPKLSSISFFATLTLIGSMNDRIFLSTNQQVLIIKLTNGSTNLDRCK